MRVCVQIPCGAGRCATRVAKRGKRCNACESKYRETKAAAAVQQELEQRKKQQRPRKRRRFDELKPGGQRKRLREADELVAAVCALLDVPPALLRVVRAAAAAFGISAAQAAVLGKAARTRWRLVVPLLRIPCERSISSWRAQLALTSGTGTAWMLAATGCVAHATEPARLLQLLAAASPYLLI